MAARPPELRATDERGWFRFQKLYDIARSVVRNESDIRRLLREAAEDEAAEGSGWLEIQVDPTSYAPRLGGLTPTIELILDAAGEAATATGVGLGVIVAANRTRNPFDARTLARLAAQYAGRGVVGFGLSNDERRGRAEDFAPAFRHRPPRRAARRAARRRAGRSRQRRGLPRRPRRTAHRPRCTRDRGPRRCSSGWPQPGVTLEICPMSNVRLGVYDRPEHVPLVALRDAGVAIALGADDPLLFGSRLVAQYEVARTDPRLLRRVAGRAGARLGARLVRPRAGACPAAGRHRRLARRPGADTTSTDRLPPPSSSAGGLGVRGRRRPGRVR